MKHFSKGISLLLLIVMALAVMLCGCSQEDLKPEKESVRLLTEEGAKEYISSKNYPEAELSKTDKHDDRVVYTFTDKACGFTFEVTSEKVKSEMEAVDLGYKEKTSDTWERSYSDYIKDKAAEKAKAEGLTAETDFSKIGSTPLAVITDKSAEELTPVLKELAAYIKGEDKHGQFTDGEIWLCTAGAESDKMYDNAFAFYLFGKDEIVDKAAREEYLRQNSTKTA